MNTPRHYAWVALILTACTGVDVYDADESEIASTVETGLVSGPTTIMGDADSYVRSGSYASQAFGSATSVHVDQDDGGTTKRGYLRFTIKDVGAITRARVRLFVTNGSASSFDAFRISSTTWAEATTTWNNAPPVDGPKIASVGSTTSGSWTEIDVTSIATANSVLSLALVGRSTDGFAFASREASANRPQLVIETATAPAPTTSGSSRGYLTTPQELAAIKSKADGGLEPYKSAVSALLVDAGSPSAWSFGIVDACNRDQMEGAAALVYAKALAFRLTGDAAYATSARAKILELSASSSTFGGSTYSGGNGCILTLGRHMPGYVMAADLLEGWSGWSAADKVAFQKWLANGVYQKIDWASDNSATNWGAVGSAATQIVADYFAGSSVPLVDKNGKAITAAAAFAEARQRGLDRSNGNEYMYNSVCAAPDDDGPGIRSHGGIPTELGRDSAGCNGTYLPSCTDSSWSYMIAYLSGAVLQAEVLLRRGDRSMFDNITADGRGSLLRAIRFVIANPNNPGGGCAWLNSRKSILEIAYRHYGDRDIGDELGIGTSSRHIAHDDNSAFPHFGTLTHGFAVSEVPTAPPVTAVP
jgi:hypothetical protein